jgi:ribose/xylose/arabinose/galactoside ABC-type transport system permease subunit
MKFISIARLFDQIKARPKDLLRVACIYALLFAVILIVNKFSGGTFLTPGNVTNVVRQISVNVVLATAMTFVIITGGIDLSVGSLVGLTGVSMALFANSAPLHGVPLVIATLAVGVAVGALCGLINAIPVVSLNLPPFITSLSMMLMARGMAFKISHGQPVPLNQSADFESTGIGYLFSGALSHLNLPGIPVVVLWMVAMAIASAIILRCTRFGRYVYAIGGNEEAARLAGIRVMRVKTAVYVLSGCFAAVAGFLLLSRFGSGSPQTGEGAELQAIAAVVVGGTSLMGGRGRVAGTFIGALFIGVLNNAMNLIGIESYTQTFVLGAVILLALVFEELRKRILGSR